MQQKKKFTNWGIFLALFFALASFAQAATITSTTSGRWSASSTWVGGVAPTATDSVFIDGHTITLDGDYTCAGLAMDAGTLQPKASMDVTLTINGDLNMLDAGQADEINYRNAGSGYLSLTFGGTRNIKITTQEDGDYSATNGISVQNLTILAPVTHYGAHIIEVFGDFTAANNGTWSENGAATIEMNGTNDPRIINISTASDPQIAFYNLTINQNVETSDDFTVTNKMTVANAVDFTASAGEVTFTNAGGLANAFIEVSGAGTADYIFYDVKFNLAGGSLAAGAAARDITILNDINVTAGTVAFQATDEVTMTGSSGEIVNAGTLTFGVLTINGDITTDDSFNLVGAGGDALIIGASGSLTATDPSAIDMQGANGDIELNTTGALQVYDLTLTGASTLNNGSIDVYGTLTDGGIFDFTAGTINFYGTSTLDLTNANSPCGAMNVYGTLTLAGVLTTADLTTAAAILTIANGGTLDMVTFSMDWNVAADASNVINIAAGGTLRTANATGIIDGANGGCFLLNSLDIALDDIVADPAANYIFDGATTQLGMAIAELQTMNDLTIITTGALTETDGDLSIAGDLSITVTGAAMNLQTGTDKITMTGTGKTLTLVDGGGGSVEFEDLEITGTVTVPSTVTEDFTIDGQLTIGAAGSFEVLAQITTYIQETAGNTTITNNNTIDDLVFYNLDLATAAGNNILTAAGTDFEVGNNINLSDATGNFDADQLSIIRFTGGTSAAPATITNAGAVTAMEFGTIAIENGAYVQLTGSDLITIDTWGTDTYEGATIDCGLYVESGGTFTVGDNAAQIDFDGQGGADDTDITNSGTLTLGLVTVANHAQAILGSTSDFNIFGDVTLTGGGGSINCASPSVVTFTGTGGAQTLTTNGGTMSFYDVVCDNDNAAGVTTSGAGETFTITGDLTVNESRYWMPNAADDIAFSGGSTTTIDVDGTYTGGNLTVGANTDVSVYGDMTLDFAGDCIDMNATGTLEFFESTLTLNNAAAAFNLTADDQLTLDNLTVTDAAATVSPDAFEFNIKGNIGSADAATEISNDRVYLTGTEDQTITDNGALTTIDFTQLTVNKTSGDVILASDIEITGTTAGDLTLTSGDIDLNGYNLILTMSTNAILSETGGNVKNTNQTTSGYIGNSVAGATGDDPGDLMGLGLDLDDLGTAGLNADGDPGNTIVQRYHLSRELSSYIGIDRYYLYNPTNNVRWDVVYINYSETELPGGNEADLALFHSANEATGYTAQITPTNSANFTYTPNIVANKVKIEDFEAADITDPGYFTLGYYSNIVVSTQDGDWSDADTWAGGAVPTASDYVIIEDDHDVILDVDATVTGLEIRGISGSEATLKPATSGSYTLTTSGSVRFNSAFGTISAVNGAGTLSMTLTGGIPSNKKDITLQDDDKLNLEDLTIQNGHYDVIGDYDLNVRGDLTVTGTGSFTVVDGDLEFNGVTEQTIDLDPAATLTLSDVVVASGSDVVTEDSFTITGANFTNNGGSFEQTGGTTTFDNPGSSVALANTGTGTVELFDLDVNGGTTVNFTGKLTVAGDFDVAQFGSFIGGANSRVSFDNGKARTITNSSLNADDDLSFYELVVTDGSVVTTASDFFIDNASSSATEGIYVQGEGSFKMTDGTNPAGLVTFDGTSATINNSTDGTLELNNIDIPDGKGVTTASNFTITGNLDANATGTFTGTATSTSTVTFKNTSSTTLTLTNSGVGHLIKFKNLIIADETDLTNDDNITIYGNVSVLGHGSFTNSDPSTVKLDNGSAKSLTADGDLIFHRLEVGDVSGNNVTTSSHIRIDDDFTVGNNGTFRASEGSVVTVTGALSLDMKDNSPTSCEFQDLIIASGAVFTSQSANSEDIKIKGDLTVEGTFNYTALVEFAGSSEQRIKGSGTITFTDITLNNSNNVVLESDISFSAAGDITFSSGNIDLNGDNTVTLDASSVISDGTGKTFINSVAGNGYVTTATTIGTTIENTNLFGFSTSQGASPFTVRRYPNPVLVGTVPSVERYYKVTGSTNPAALTLSYFNSEINDHAYTELAMFKASTNETQTWTPLGGTATTGAVALTGSVSGYGTGDFFAMAPQMTEFAELPTTGVHPDNEPAASPLLAGSQNQVIFAFSVTSNGDTDLEEINLHLDRNPSGMFQNFELYEDSDDNIASYGRSLVVAATAFAQDLNFIIPIGSKTLTPGQTKYYFLVADVVSSVDESYGYTNSAVFDQDDVTLNPAGVSDFRITGDNYTFAKSYVDVSTENTPSDTYLPQGGSDESLFAFALQPQYEDAPDFTFTSVQIAVTLGNGAEDDDFENFGLWCDANMNGYKDGEDYEVATGEVATLPGDDVLVFTLATGYQTISEDKQYVLICDVESDAVEGGTILLEIEDDADIDITGATINDDSPYTGAIKQVVDASSTTPSKLVITNITPDQRLEANQGLPSNVLVSGQRFSVAVEVQDASDVLSEFPTPSQIEIKVTGTLGTLTTGVAAAQTVDGTNSYIYEDVLLTTTTGGTGTIKVEYNTDGSIADAESETYVIYAPEPFYSLDGLTATVVSSTSMSVDWANPDNDESLIVIKQGSAPSVPVDGTDYTAATDNNLANITAAGTIGTSSYVMYKGTTDNAVTLSGLTPGATYYVAVYNYNGSSDYTNYLTEPNPENATIVQSITMPYGEPSTAASGLTFSNVTANSMNVSWTRGNGSNCLVVAAIGSTTIVDPTDGEEYTANAAFGTEETALNNGFVVFNGNGNSVEVTGLAAGTTYTFAVYEYNGTNGYTNYNASEATDTRSTLEVEPAVQASNITFTEMTIGTNTVLKVNWAKGNGEGRIVIAKAGTAIESSDYPSDQSVDLSLSGGIGQSGATVTFGSTTQSGDAYIVYAGTSDEHCYLTGLSYGVTYYFQVFEYNGSGASASVSTMNYNISSATGNPASRIADSYESNDLFADAKEIPNLDGTEYKGIISSGSDIDWFYFTPDVAGGYKNLVLRLTGLPQDYTLELYDENGNILRRSKHTDTDSELVALNNVPEGDYYIKIFSADGEYSLQQYLINVVAKTIEHKSSNPQ